MSALLYLLAALLIGDTLARPILNLPDARRRLATAFVVGLLSTSWLTYLSAYLLRETAVPLEGGNLVTAAVALVVLAGRIFAARTWLADRLRGIWARPRGVLRDGLMVPASAGDPEAGADWILIAGATLLVGWMTSQTYAWSGGELQIGTKVWSDFGPVTAIAQSFGVGSNFPTEYPHFAGFPILYHFLFYFAVGNLTFLGWDPALALNVLSTASTVSMIILVVSLGRRLLGSGLVGRIGALLFFVHGSLAWVGFVQGFPTPEPAYQAAIARSEFLPSGFPYRGEDWGVWTQVVFLNQRHLASSIGALLVVVLFVLDRHAARDAERLAAAGPGVRRWFHPRSWLDAADRLAVSVQDRMARPLHHLRVGLSDHHLLGWVVAGWVLGMLPMWNSAVFLASAIVMAVLFVLLPHRAQMTATAIAAASAAIPQLLVLRPPAVSEAGTFPVFHWGYVVEDATIGSAALYLAFTFGPKLALAALPVILGTWRQRIVLAAFTALVAAAFLVQFSVEVLANHKLLNIWLVVLNVFAAAGLVRLWRAGSGGARGRIVRAGGRATAMVMVMVIAIGGLIDLAPVRNAQKIGIRLEGDRLVDWVERETGPRDVFLTDLYVTHPILLAGRRLFYGWPYYAWSAGYPVTQREARIREILGATDPSVAVALLQREGIDFVAIDDGLRGRSLAPYLNESLFADTFERVFSDPDGRYGHLDIYRVPMAPVDAVIHAPLGLLDGGEGGGLGQFRGPLGIAVAPDGTVLVADTQNDRIQRFSMAGPYLGVFGGRGTANGRFHRPSGVAVDSRGHIFVADTGNDRVQEFEPGGTFVGEWRGPDPGLSAPKDLVVGPGDVLYVVDEGNGRVVERAADGSTRTFSWPGSGPGQLLGPTGIAADSERIYVADAGNGRLVIFPRDGSSPSAIPVPEWGIPRIQHPDVLIAGGGQIILSGFRSNSVVVLGPDGRREGTLAPVPPDRFDGPAALAAQPDGRIYVVELLADRVSLLPGPS